ncbi:cytochrome c5 family protein [Legionella sp. W05-934-2]|jgi:cytochrome c5|uniref:c-type cytochrome n=1 Tax=Legionella sp. W05-934-2 TaxID=1198649 RepID=UPI003461E200
MFTSVHADDYDRQVVQERIAPVGSVRLQNADAQTPVEKQPAQPEQVAKEPGEEIYQQYCAVCHKSGLAGAPIFRDKAAWEPRLAKMKMDELVASAIKGKNAMPAKGTCLDCSDKDIKEAIEYMLPRKS